MKPTLIKGGIFTDERGTISFVNDFKFTEIERFYILKNSEAHPLRAWQGHKLDNKYFYCIAGSFKIYFVRIDNWENPSKNLKVDSQDLESTNSQILHIPAGYANAVRSLERNSIMISFSTLPLNAIKDDDVRFEMNMWKAED